MLPVLLDTVGPTNKSFLSLKPIFDIFSVTEDDTTDKKKPSQITQSTEIGMEVYIDPKAAPNGHTEQTQKTENIIEFEENNTSIRVNLSPHDNTKAAMQSETKQASSSVKTEKIKTTKVAIKTNATTKK